MATPTSGGKSRHVVKMLPCCKKITTQGFGPTGEISLKEARRVAAKNRRLLVSLVPTPSGHSTSSRV